MDEKSPLCAIVEAQYYTLLDHHCAASVFESADSIRKAPVASKWMAGAKSDVKAGQVATHLLAGPVPLSDLLLIY